MRRGFLFFSLRLGHGGRAEGGTHPPPRLPSYDWFDRVLRQNSRLDRREKAIAPLKFAIPPPETPGSPGSVVREFYFRCGGETMVAGSARTVRTSAQNTRLCLENTSFTSPRDAAPKSRRELPLARKFGGAAWVGGQRFVWNCFPVAEVSPRAAGERRAPRGGGDDVKGLSALLAAARARGTSGGRYSPPSAPPLVWLVRWRLAPKFAVWQERKSNPFTKTCDSPALFRPARQIRCQSGFGTFTPGSAGFLISTFGTRFLLPRAAPLPRREGNFPSRGIMGV